MKWLVVLVVLFASPALAAPASAPMSLDDGIINAFQVMCTQRQSLDFDGLNADAKAMLMREISDNSAPEGDGVVHEIGWAGMLDTGPFAFIAGKWTLPEGTRTSCAVEASSSSADAFRKDLVKTMDLPAAPQPDIGGGFRSYYWDGFYGDDTSIILRDMTPQGDHTSVMLKVLWSPVLK